MKTPKIANAVGYIDDELIKSATESKKTVKKKTFIKWTSFAACFAVTVIVAAAAVPEFFGDRKASPTQPELTEEDGIYAEGDGNGTDDTFCGNYWIVSDGSGESSLSGNDSTTVAATATSNSNNGKTTDIVTDSTTVPINNEQPVTGAELAFSEAYFYSVSDGVFSDYISGKVIAEDNIGSKIDDVAVSAGWKNNADEWLTNESLRAEVYLINDISKDVAVALKFIDKGDALTTTHYYVIMNPDADLTAVKEYIIAPIAPDKADNEFGVETTVQETATEEFVVAYTSQFANE